MIILAIKIYLQLWNYLAKKIASGINYFQSSFSSNWTAHFYIVILYRER